MTRIEPVRADLQLRAFDTARRRYGWLPNTIRVMARGSNAADLYLKAGEAARAVGRSTHADN